MDCYEIQIQYLSCFWLWWNYDKNSGCLDWTMILDFDLLWDTNSIFELLLALVKLWQELFMLLLFFPGHVLDVLARVPLWKYGLDYRHGTGHGIGSYLNVHEGTFKNLYHVPFNRDTKFSLKPASLWLSQNGRTHSKCAVVIL